MITRLRVILLSANGWPGNEAGSDQLIRVLGIETSCDETAASVIEADAEGKSRILSNVVLSQIDEHAAFGGVVPEIAARAHVEALDGIVEAALNEAGASLDDMDAIAATAGPGLVGGLIVGLMTAKAIAAASNRPLLAINHLEGHALTARLTDGVAFPYLLLLVSGGHTQIVLVRGVGDYERWATTIDDALGEAFDKTAKMLGLAHPGGPSVEKAAEAGDAARFDFPRPMKGARQPDFSFSGLKTAVRQAATAIAPLTEQDIADICASFQAAVTDALADRVKRALMRFREEVGHAESDRVSVPYVAPLCPAGHLPHKGGDRLAGTLTPATADAPERAPTPKLPVSPLVGEMSGRTEGGNVGRADARRADLIHAQERETTPTPSPSPQGGYGRADAKSPSPLRGSEGRARPVARRGKVRGGGQSVTDSDRQPISITADAPVSTLVVAGGVAANRAIRKSLQDLCSAHGFRFLAPPLALCSDNAAMIAWAGIERILAGLADQDAMAFAPRSRWPLDEASAPLIGSGRRGAKA